MFVGDGGECFIAQSYAKNMGLYGERVGALSIVSHHLFTYIFYLFAMMRILRALTSFVMDLIDYIFVYADLMNFRFGYLICYYS